jgi:alkylation response protein AidB-like acyl-CoA dehydrogenase
MTGQRECVVGELRAVTRSFLKEKSPELTVRTLMETPDGNDPEVWVLACRELGIAGLVVPEEQGGLASGTTELGAVFAESGRVLWCSPLLATSALATSALLAVDGEPASKLLDSLRRDHRDAGVGGHPAGHQHFTSASTRLYMADQRYRWLRRRRRQC